MAITASEWAAVLDREYLAQFVPSGGAASKIAVVPGAALPSTSSPANASVETSSAADTPAEAPAVPSRAVLPLEVAASERGFVVAHVASSRTRVQMVDQIFFAVSRQIDWRGLARRWLLEQFTLNGFEVAPDQDLTDLGTLAQERGMARPELMGMAQRWIVNGLLRDSRFDKEFRTAMAMLCQAALSPGNVAPSDADVIERWLRGERFSLSTLKRLQIFGKIARHNARRMLSSLALWLHVNGHAGLILSLDATSLWDDGPRDLNSSAPRYTRNAVLDFYEVLRQFIDETDETEHFMLLVAAAPGFWTHPKKGVDQYTALKMRVADEVRDRTRANPLGAAVRLELAA